MRRVYSALGEGGIHIEWKASSAYGKHHTEGFKIYKKTGTDGEYELLTTIADNTILDYYDADTIPGETYSYYVIGYIGNTLGSPTLYTLNNPQKWTVVAKEFPTE